MRYSLFAVLALSLTGMSGAALAADQLDVPGVSSYGKQRAENMTRVRRDPAVTYEQSAHVPPVVPPAADKKSQEVTRLSLLSETSFEVGASFSHYHYQEPQHNAQVSTNGLKYGFVFDGTMGLPYSFFAKIDGRYAAGRDDYKSLSGKLDGMTGNILDVRLLVGRDFLINDQLGVSPFVGVGYRNFFNDGRGYTDENASGYRRDSQYVYAPIGVTPRVRIDESSRISFTLEYDQLIAGKQTTHLSDAGVVLTGVSNPYAGTYGNFNNQQFAGYGLRGDVMYETLHWSIGPFFNYWNINQSKSACTSFVSTTGTNYVSCGWIEPHNQTLEYGLQAKYRLY